MFVLKLHCACGRPWAYISDGSIIVESRHNGNTHTNSLSLAKLLALIKGSSQIGDEVLLNKLIGSLGLAGTVSGELLTDHTKGLDKSA